MGARSDRVWRALSVAYCISRSRDRSSNLSALCGGVSISAWGGFDNHDRIRTAKLTGQEEYTIYPTSPTHFFWKIVDAQLGFEVDEQAQKVISHQFSQGTLDSKIKV